MLDKVYLFIFLSHDGWVPCGLLEYDQLGRYSTSRFKYGKKYLERTNKISIDPVQLPLVENTIDAPEDFILFNGIRDAGPDKWGRFLLDKKFGRELSELEYVVATGPDRVGALAFSNRPDDGLKLFTPKGFVHFQEKRLDLEWCAGAAEDAVKSEETERLKRFLQYAPTLGGARPKATVNWKGRPYLAKFSLSLDERDEPLLEFAAMTLAHNCKLNVPKIDKSVALGRTVYLIERFDRTSSEDPIPFISGLTATGLHERDYAEFSYHRLVDAIVKLSRQPIEDLRELFKRMLFNILVFNNDDHPRNFGFLFDGEGYWNLSPLYDVVPTTVHTQSFFLAMTVGEEGKKASIANALSMSERFRLSKTQAQAIVDEMCDSVSTWKQLFQNCGVTKIQIQALENSFSEKT